LKQRDSPGRKEIALAASNSAIERLIERAARIKSSSRQRSADTRSRCGNCFAPRILRDQLILQIQTD